MKEKVIFMMINMNVGGTERALLNMIEEMPDEKYDITILMLEKYGGFLESIPKRVHQKVFNGYSNMKPILNGPPKEVVTNLFKNRLIIKRIILILIYLISKLTKNKAVLFKYLLKDTPVLKGEYDTAIAYAGPMDFISYFVVQKINANKKIQWIHFDVSKIGFNKKFTNGFYRRFDKIYTVSCEGKQKFIEKLPQFSDKTVPFLNKISQQKLIKMSNKGEGFTDEFDGLRILTVGRLSPEKGQDLAISVMGKLKENGFNVRWYCVGNGNEREKYEEQIQKHGVEKEFRLLGSKLNPYPFMKQCDIYVQPSRHEGFCITVAEAKCFNKPIVSTNFTGANELIINGETGVITNFDVYEMVDALERLVNDVQLRKIFKSNLTREGLENIKEERRKFRTEYII